MAIMSLINDKTRVIKTLALKELRGFFNSPVAYVVIVIYLLFAGWFFASPLFLINQITIDHVLENMPLLFIFFIPAITMRLMAEETKIGTIETLSTLPIEDYEIILGKYIAVVVLFFIAILGTLVHPISLSFLGSLDWGQVGASYLGLFFMGCSYLAIGVFASSLTRNQIVAFIIGLSLCFVFFIIGKMLIVVPGFLKNIADFIGMDSHVSNISKGIIDTRDLLYFASVIAALLYGTLLVVTNRRLR
jgi:ABC-2 type transport system permease protein